MVNLPKDSCTGCSACASVCPRHAIQMKENSEGFLYPEVDEKACVNCGACLSVCHVLHDIREVRPLQAYAGVYADDAVRLGSSSGGLYSAIAEWVLSHEGVVYGAIYGNSGKDVFHANSDDVPFQFQRKSKYVESDLRDTYLRVQNCLKQGRWVLFSGTPCQVSGLYAFLGERAEKLLTVDFVCHGVPSRRVYREFCEDLERRYRAKLCDVDFRPKLTGWRRHSIQACFENGAKYRRDAALDRYFSGFMAQNLFLRRCCYECQFRCSHQSDFTLADYWGVKKEDGIREDGFGLSLVMINTRAALSCWNEVSGKTRVQEVAPENYHYALQRRTSECYCLPDRERFFNLAAQKGSSAALMALVRTATWKRRMAFEIQMRRFCLVKFLRRLRTRRN